MNSLINVMSKLDEKEGMVIQFVVRSAKKGWHQKATVIRKQIYKGASLQHAIKFASSGPIMTVYILLTLFNSMALRVIFQRMSVIPYQSP